jgi:hypothetical protein
MKKKHWKRFFRDGWVHADKVEMVRESFALTCETQATENHPTQCLLVLGIEQLACDSGGKLSEWVLSYEDAKVVGDMLLGFHAGVHARNEAIDSGYYSAIKHASHRDSIADKLGKELMQVTGATDMAQAIQYALDRLEKNGKSG